MSVRVGGPEDRSNWDAFVESHPEASPYHLMGWSLAVQEAYGHEALFLISEQSGHIDGVLPLCAFSVPLKGSTLCSLPFCDIGGCVTSDTDVERELIAHALELAAERGTTLHLRTRAVGDLTGEVGKEYTGKVSMILELPETADELSASLGSKLRSQIRKAEKNGLVFSKGTGVADLNQFYRVFAENMRDLGSPVHSSGWFEAIHKHLAGKLITGVVSLDGKAVGAGLVLKTKRLAAIPWASTLGKYNRLAPNMLLYWSLLKIVTVDGAERFDFGRSSFGEGTYRFKKQWGAKPVLLEWRDYDANGAISSDMGQSTTDSRRFAEMVWKRLPLPIANVVGPRIRKYVSL